MEFKDILNGFIEELDCSGRELAQASGLSPATVSRYRSGERTPENQTDRDKLICGLAALARERGLAGPTEEDVGAALAPLFPGGMRHRAAAGQSERTAVRPESERIRSGPGDQLRPVLPLPHPQRPAAAG